MCVIITESIASPNLDPELSWQIDLCVIMSYIHSLLSVPVRITLARPCMSLSGERSDMSDSLRSLVERSGRREETAYLSDREMRYINVGILWP